VSSAEAQDPTVRALRAHEYEMTAEDHELLGPGIRVRRIHKAGDKQTLGVPWFVPISNCAAVY